MKQHFVTTALVLGSMTCTVLANLSLKTGAQRSSGVGVSLPAVLNSHVAMGAAWFALAFVLYALVLRRLPLSLAGTIFSVQWVLVVLAAHLVLHESIGGMRWLGIALMAVGLIVVSLSPEAKSAVPSVVEIAEGP